MDIVVSGTAILKWQIKIRFSQKSSWNDKIQALMCVCVCDIIHGEKNNQRKTLNAVNAL